MASLRSAVLRTSSRARVPLALRLTTTTTNRHPVPQQQQRRPIHRPAALARPYKDDMDRESLKPKAHEYTHSGTDDQVAASEDAAFDPDKTSPEAQKDTAGAEASEGTTNPLEASPANRDFAGAGAGGGKKEDRPQHGGQAKASGGGSPPKKGKVG
ncbi:hypothetical protein F5X99DRAFT_413871 [Biscogniauxia marginata]|nr:hypothetical protein F5X99DRAFT_413871 [Biscogniauxia marginata]